MTNHTPFKQFFDSSTSLSQLRTEQIYNAITDELPSKATIKDSLDVAKVTEYLTEKGFEKLSEEFTYKNDTLYSGSYWQGKDKYHNCIVEVSEAKGEFSQIFGEDREPSDKPGDECTCVVNLVHSSAEIIKELVSDLVKFKYKSDARIHLLTNEYSELGISPMDVKPSTSNLELNYGASFPALHEEILTSLETRNSGLYLFHGEPGTGKSSYISHLLTTIKKRKVLYIPINLVDSLTSPDFLPLLMRNKNLILVIEDAEKALIAREDNVGNSGVVASILNLTDSFIGQSLNVTIIATFNTKKENLDRALLRKGRLRISHEFKALSRKDSQKLIDSLKIEHTVVEPMTLAEIYYLDEDNRHKVEEPRAIGFGA